MSRLVIVALTIQGACFVSSVTCAQNRMSVQEWENDRKQLVNEIKLAEMERDRIEALEEELGTLEDKKSNLNAKLKNLVKKQNDLSNSKSKLNLDYQRNLAEYQESLKPPKKPNLSRPRFRCPNGNSYETCHHHGLKGLYQRQRDRFQRAQESYQRQLEAYNRQKSAISKYEVAGEDILMDLSRQQRKLKDEVARAKKNSNSLTINKNRLAIEIEKRRSDLAVKMAKIDRVDQLMERQRPIRIVSDAGIEILPIGNRQLAQNPPESQAAKNQKMIEDCTKPFARALGLYPDKETREKERQIANTMAAKAILTVSGAGMSKGMQVINGLVGPTEIPTTRYEAGGFGAKLLLERLNKEHRKHDNPKSQQHIN